MKAKKGVIDFLNKILTNELTAINQYFLHGEMCGNWGYEQLHNEIRKHSIDEMKHAEELIEHILYLEGVPNLQRLGTLKIGETVPEQFKSDLALEHEAVDLSLRPSLIVPLWEISPLAQNWKVLLKVKKNISIGSKRKWKQSSRWG